MSFWMIAGAARMVERAVAAAPAPTSTVDERGVGHVRRQPQAPQPLASGTSTVTSRPASQETA